MSKLRDRFEEYFEDATGLESSEHPNQMLVEDMWCAFREGAIVGKEIEDE